MRAESASICASISAISFFKPFVKPDTLFLASASARFCALVLGAPPCAFLLTATNFSSAISALARVSSAWFISACDSVLYR